MPAGRVPKGVISEERPCMGGSNEIVDHLEQNLITFCIRGLDAKFIRTCVALMQISTSRRLADRILRHFKERMNKV